MTTEELQSELEYRRARLAFAESLGKPLHIKRCRDRVESLAIKVASRVSKAPHEEEVRR